MTWLIESDTLRCGSFRKLGVSSFGALIGSPTFGNSHVLSGSGVTYSGITTVAVTTVHVPEVCNWVIMKL